MKEVDEFMEEYDKEVKKKDKEIFNSLISSLLPFILFGLTMAKFLTMFETNKEIEKKEIEEIKVENEKMFIDSGE